MEDDATQKATQEVLDPRRVGRNNSGLNQKDISDVLAILHPASPAAIQAVQMAAEHRPQHVFSRNANGTFADDFSDIDEQETIILNGPDAPFNPTSRAGDDIALRMSSELIDPKLGFVFGRNTNFSDIVLPQDTGRRISNQHFRIFLNADAILMCEDLSTNGTFVDETLLLCRHYPRFNKVRMIQPGSIISIRNSTDGEMIKFIVTIPPRISHLEQYEEKVRNFLARCAPNDVQLQGESGWSSRVTITDFMQPFSASPSVNIRQQ